MRINADTSLVEVARIVCTALQEVGVTVVLTGGSAATYYAPDAYQSEDIDFVSVRFQPRSGDDVEASLVALGYRRERDHYRHASNPYPVEFPPGPLAVGREILSQWHTERAVQTVLHVLEPTDSCKDRLAAFFHWNDRAGLAQALAVARAVGDEVDFEALSAWADSEGAHRGFAEFARRLDLST